MVQHQLPFNPKKPKLKLPGRIHRLQKLREIKSRTDPLKRRLIELIRDNKGTQKLIDEKKREWQDKQDLKRDMMDNNIEITRIRHILEKIKQERIQP